MVQILMLQALEEALGGMIPIQSFFDLIVGTGYVSQISNQ